MDDGVVGVGVEAVCPEQGFENRRGGVGDAGVDGREDGVFAAGGVDGVCPRRDVCVHGIHVPRGIPPGGVIHRDVRPVAAIGLHTRGAVQARAIERHAALHAGRLLCAVRAGDLVDGGEEAGGPRLGGRAGLGFY